MTLEEVKMKMLMDSKLVWYTSVLFGVDVSLGESPMGTAHTDGIKIVIDPDFFKKLSFREATGLLLHELRHITDLHIMRKNNRDALLWNVACDYAINWDIASEGFSLPSGGLLDSAYADMSAEAIYEELLQNGTSEEANDLQPSDIPSQEVLDAVKDIVIQATQQAQRIIQSTGIGTIPASILRQVEEWVNPVVPWTTILRRYMSAKAASQHSWKRPNRRYHPRGLYMPSLYNEQMGPITVFLDASGSVTDKDFNMQVGQFKWIHKNLKPSVLNLVVFDTQIKQVITFKPHEPINVKFTGMGGTNITCVVEYMEKNPCDCNLIFSDGMFHTLPLDKVKGDVLCCIYNNPTFTWEKTHVIRLD